MKAWALTCLVVCILVTGLGAQTAEDPMQSAGAAARAAQAQLDRATEALTRAEGARDRVRALTETLGAYEAGLSSLRAGLREAARQEAALAGDLAAQESEIATLIGALQALSRAPAPARLLHPEGPAGSARASLLVRDAVVALEADAADLRARLTALQELQTLQEAAAKTLQEGLSKAQDARVALSHAVEARSDLPRRFVEDPIQTAVLIAATDTLESFADAVAMIATEEAQTPLASIAPQKGTLPWPVRGELLRGAGLRDAAGVLRPGVLIATPDHALVTTPVPATLRYAGPLLNYGLVAILEPQPDTLFVLAGLAELYGETGQFLAAGDAVGLMGGSTAAPSPDTAATTSQLSDGGPQGGGNTRADTLYIEVRLAGRSVDPERWFQTGRE